MQPNDVAIRKRNQITKANRTMFIWIAIASALVGAAVVVGIFLSQQLFYNEQVLLKKQQTIDTLKQNNAVVEDLKSEIRILDTNADLATVKANPSDQTLQVILDALPSEPNQLALGSSLQNKLLTGIPGLQPIQQLQVDSVDGGTEQAGVVEGEDVVPNSINFRFTVLGTQDALKQVLENLERSIRTIEVVSVRIENQADGSLAMTVSARAFYEPTVNLQLKEQVVPR